MLFDEDYAGVAEWEGSRWLRVSQLTKFTIVLPETLPERFTVEFDFVTHDGSTMRWPGRDESRARASTSTPAAT